MSAAPTVSTHRRTAVCAVPIIHGTSMPSEWDKLRKEQEAYQDFLLTDTEEMRPVPDATRHEYEGREMSPRWFERWQVGPGLCFAVLLQSLRAMPFCNGTHAAGGVGLPPLVQGGC